MRQIILDTETTGISIAEGHRIIEIGCVELIDRVITGNTYHCYINPQREVEQEAIEVHGITNEFLVDKPVFPKIADEFLAFVTDAELIIHNAPFDVGFLNHELSMVPTKMPTIEQVCQVVDTLVMARDKYPGQRNSLDALCKRLGVDNKHREWHGALLDSELLAQVYLYMTGGQTQLFAEEQASVVEHDDVGIERIDQQRGALKVIQPTEAEMTLHDDYLHKMKQAGACVWQNTAD